MSEAVSIGLLVGSERPPRWFTRATELVEEQTPGSVDEVFVAESASADVDKDVGFYLDDVREKGCWAPVAMGQKLVTAVVGPLPDLRREPIPAPHGGGERDTTYFEPEKESPFRFAVPTEVVESLSRTDVVLHWGVGILTGAVLDAPTFGVWGVHHGDVTEYRGGPPGFWEFLHGRDSTTVTLQRFSEALDAGEIVVEREVDIADAPTWREVRRRQCRATPTVLVQGIESVADGALETTSPEQLGRIYRPTDRDCAVAARYLAKTTVGWLTSR